MTCAVSVLLSLACGESATPGMGSAGQPALAGAAGNGLTSGGAGGVVMSLGGQTGGGVAGSPSAGGQAGGGGQAGLAGGGTGGNAPVDDAAAFQLLDGFQLLDPCDLTSYQVEAAPGAVCPQLDAVKNQHVMLKLAGDAGVTYQVTLRVRGVVERYWYAGGELDAKSQVFYTGGKPTVGGLQSACKNQASSLPFPLPAELTPSDGCFNGFNVFAMAVSEPQQHYFLNYTEDKDGDRPPHAVYAHDYTVTIAIQGQASLDFYVIGSDEHQCYNHDQVVDGVTLPASPYIGEFVQFDVLQVTRAQ